MGTDFKKIIPKTMSAPEQLPASPEEEATWQEANRSFWESNPMRYDWNEQLEFKEHTEDFYKEIDRKGAATPNFIHQQLHRGSNSYIFCKPSLGVSKPCAMDHVSSNRLRVGLSTNFIHQGFTLCRCEFCYSF